MTNLTTKETPPPRLPHSRRTLDAVNAGLKKRHAAERRFRLYGVMAILVAVVFLVVLFSGIIYRGHSAFSQTFVKLDVQFDANTLGLKEPIDPKKLARADYNSLVKTSLREMFPLVNSRRDKRALYHLVSPGTGFFLRDMLVKNPDLMGTIQQVWVPANDDLDMYIKEHGSLDTPEAYQRISSNQLNWIKTLQKEGRIEKRFNTQFFTSGDSREPELAGIWGAVSGSFYTLLVTLILSFPMGVATAVYLEELAPKGRNKLADIIEVNINNLAAVPSIVFGLLGLAVFINFFGLPRSAPLVGGLVLTLMTLPTIIITSRAALKSVPPSIREAALALGASPVQTVFYHVLPLAMPGMLTGTIIGMAQALGESAPLLMIGMVAFIVDIPSGIFDPATVLPVQVYLWADSPERAFMERTAAAIMILLAFLIIMNTVAIVLRKRFERRW